MVGGLLIGIHSKNRKKIGTRHSGIATFGTLQYTEQKQMLLSMINHRVGVASQRSKESHRQQISGLTIP